MLCLMRKWVRKWIMRMRIVMMDEDEDSAHRIVINDILQLHPTAAAAESSFRIIIRHHHRQHISIIIIISQVDIMDSDMLSRDDLICGGVIPFESLLSGSSSS